jgi:hypothetical protein
MEELYAERARRHRGRHEAGRGGPGRGQAALEQYKPSSRTPAPRRTRSVRTLASRVRRSSRRCVPRPRPRRLAHHRVGQAPDRGRAPAGRRPAAREVGTLSTDPWRAASSARAARTRSVRRASSTASSPSSRPATSSAARRLRAESVRTPDAWIVARRRRSRPGGLRRRPRSGGADRRPWPTSCSRHVGRRRQRLAAPGPGRPLREPAGQGGPRQRLFGGKVGDGACAARRPPPSSAGLTSATSATRSSPLRRRACSRGAEAEGRIDDVEDELFRFERIVAGDTACATP